MANELIEQLNLARAALKAKRDALADEVAEIDLALGTVATLPARATRRIAQHGSGARRIRDFLASHGPASAAEIVGATGIGKGVYVYLNAAVASGDLVRDGEHGTFRYSVAPTESNGVAARP